MSDNERHKSTNQRKSNEPEKNRLDTWEATVKGVLLRKGSSQQQYVQKTRTKKVDKRTYRQKDDNCRDTVLYAEGHQKRELNRLLRRKKKKKALVAGYFHS
jgi:hypothetical protein